MLLLDTDALSLIQRGEGLRFEALADMLDHANADVYVTVISLDEQIHGAFKEIASSGAMIRVRGYHRLHQLANDYCGRPILGNNILELASILLPYFGLRRAGGCDLRQAQGDKGSPRHQRPSNRIHRNLARCDSCHRQRGRLREGSDAEIDADSSVRQSRW